MASPLPPHTFTPRTSHLHPSQFIPQTLTPLTVTPHSFRSHTTIVDPSLVFGIFGSHTLARFGPAKPNGCATWARGCAPSLRAETVDLSHVLGLSGEPHAGPKPVSAPLSRTVALGCAPRSRPLFADLFSRFRPLWASAIHVLCPVPSLKNPTWITSVTRWAQSRNACVIVASANEMFMKSCLWVVSAALPKFSP
jgi:hypothetical protein